MPVKYDRIGSGYNRTRKADPHLADRMFELLQVGAGSSCLDIGCGTGNYTVALARRGLAFTGVDPSEKMLEKASLANPQVRWLQGTAEAIPLPTRSMDGALASLTLHHWADLEAGCREVRRVLRPDARWVIFTSTPEQMQGYWLRHYFPNMLEDSIAQMPSMPLVEGALHQAGFAIEKTEAYEIRDDLQDLFLYAGKDRPELYLDAEVRQGISSFSNLANAAEVEGGLTELQRDLRSGKIEEVVARYRHDLGDYLFIVGVVPR